MKLSKKKGSRKSREEFRKDRKIKSLFHIFTTIKIPCDATYKPNSNN